VTTRTIQQLIEKSEHTDPLVVEHILKAIEYRNEGNSPDLVRNTYLKDLAIPQIVLFDILANQFPIVLSAQSLVNNLICEHAKGFDSITLLDIGVGRGIQMVRLLKLLNQIDELKEVNIIGIELFEPALIHTENQLHQLNEELRIKINFLPINSSVESTEFHLISSWIKKQASPLLVNASLCLHHIQEQQERSKLFENVKSLNPMLFTLIEPNANCFTNSFDLRLVNTFLHFNALYCYINTLTLKDEEKKGLKQFFSTELFDAIALPDQHRFEKYEEGQAWVMIASAAGFKSVDLTDSFKDISIPDIEVQTAPEKYIWFGYHGIPLLSVIGFE
jgi:hypothetical protein